MRPCASQPVGNLKNARRDRNQYQSSIDRSNLQSQASTRVSIFRGEELAKCYGIDAISEIGRVVPL